MVGDASMCWSHCSAFCRTTTRESRHGVPHGALLSGTHPYPCNYSLYAILFSASRTRRKTQLHAATACPPHSARVRTRNCMPTASRDCGQVQAVTGAKCKPRLRPATRRDHATAAGGTHPSHEVVMTCTGFWKRRARGRISLASNQGPKNTLMGIPLP